METKRQPEKRKHIDVPKPKKEDLLALEDCISSLIIIMLKNCPYHGIHMGSLTNNNRISENTIKDNLRQGKVSPRQFESYLKAIRTIRQFTFETDADNNFSCTDIEKAKENMCDCYEILHAINEKYKKLKELPYSLFPDVINKWESAQKLSQRFWYLLNKCFDAFCTLNPDDILFLNKFFKNDEAERQMIVTKMDDSKGCNYSRVICELVGGEGELWIDAHGKYSDTAGKSSARDNWEKLNDKLKNVLSVKAVDVEVNQKIDQAFLLTNFFAIIWPEEGETDTKFGPEEIKALIIWKYFLTEESRQELLDKFCEDQQNN